MKGEGINAFFMGFYVGNHVGHTLENYVCLQYVCGEDL